MTLILLEIPQSLWAYELDRGPKTISPVSGLFHCRMPQGKWPSRSVSLSAATFTRNPCKSMSWLAKSLNLGCLNPCQRALYLARSGRGSSRSARVTEVE